MRRQIPLLAFLLLALLPLAAQAQENPFLGKWDITATGPNGTFPYWLEVKEEKGQIVGHFLNRGGSVTKLPEIRIENGELVFSPSTNANAPKIVHRARVEEGRLLGTVSGGNAKISWIGVRPPSWGTYDANARHRFGTPVELFDGKSLAHWDVQFKDRESGWSVENGLMTNVPRANNLVSKHRFEDFKIRAEYKLEPKSNSGIYLRGRYELQVLDDHGKEPESHGHMALYSRVAPTVNASLPAGEWQVMEATIVGNRLTVLLNGKKIHDNIVIEGITGGALDANEGEPGPIMIQGDHGKVTFRRITVTPILNSSSK